MKKGEIISSKVSEAVQEDKEKFNEELRIIYEKIVIKLKSFDEKAKNLGNLTKIEKIDKNKKQNLQRLLKEMNEKYISAYNENLKNIENKKNKQAQEIVSIITDLYFLTEEYLVKIGAIKNSVFLMTGVVKGEDGTNYYIRTDFKEELFNNEKVNNFLSISKSSSEKGNKIGIRFNEAAVLEKMKNIIKEDTKEKEKAKNLYLTYQRFIKPYLEHEFKNNEWKMNIGVSREAFEGYLEKYYLNLPETFNFNKRMPSEGRRWVMYRYASGSDPYFTGPDTSKSQVKSENASLVSNIDTVLNTALYIKNNHNNIIQNNDEAVDKIKRLLKTQSNEEINTFSKKIYDSLKEDVKKQIQKQFKGRKLKLTD